jgi:signal transduction histidine kinase
VPHELAQPLSEVRGYAELMLEESFSEEQQRDFLEIIAAAAVRAGDLMHAIGRLARPDQPPPPRHHVAGEDLLILEPERRPPTQQSEEPPP